MKKKWLAITLASVCAGSALCLFSACEPLIYTPDYATWSKKIIDNTLLASIRIEEKEWEVGQGMEEGVLAQGSGIIIYETQDLYYALTNNHVVYRSGNNRQSIEVVNCYDTKHTAGVVYQDANYDLAVISFNKKNHQIEEVDLEVVALAASNPVGLAAIAAIGSPEGRHNSVTYGKALRYETVSVGGGDSTEQSNVTFPALVHSAYTLSGSSGGAIINEQLEIVGIHYACGYQEGGSYVEGYAIPVEKIVEFLLAAEEAKQVELGV